MFAGVKFVSYLCKAKKGRDGLYRRRSKVKLGFEPSIDFAKTERFGLPVSIPYDGKGSSCLTQFR